jgi:predicted PhzF superfamily epimerase YddE/YHI9
MRLTFVTVDVFTDRQFGGNPLAVVIDADGLSSRQMQAIAAEFNLAETTFVLPPQDAAHTAQVRIFTPRAEMPFAGHPNVGTATGAANVALIGLLAQLRPEPDLQLAKKIAQGVDMGRPSLLEARAEKTAGVVTATYIGGTCVPVMRGVLDLA